MIVLPSWEISLYPYLLAGFAATAALAFTALQFVVAPYGRHTSKQLGPLMPSRLGWVVMEAPAVLAFVACMGAAAANTSSGSGLAVAVLSGAWLLHYTHRAFVYPFRRPARGHMAVVVVACGALFNCINAYLNGRYFYGMGHATGLATVSYDATWLWDPRCMLGLALFAVGLVINIHSDTLLLRLRAPGQSGYKIPHGGLFRWVSCPNYLGELIIWAGFALAAWSWPAALFFVWTAANLVPRARANHVWYLQTFADYPVQRRALVPGLY